MSEPVLSLRDLRIWYGAERCGCGPPGRAPGGGP